MQYLILSDIHSNWEGLEAVLQHAEGSYDEICCLGDVVGYGADPNAVTDWVRKNVKHVIRGNHDKACCGLEDPVMFNPVARQAAEWTLQNLTDENRDYLYNLRKGPLELNDFVMVHGSIVDEDEYVVDPRQAAAQFPLLQGRLAFFGHTHVQGGFLLSADDCRVIQNNADNDNATLSIVAGDTPLLNPGSVGQPRDLNWKSGYVFYHSEQRVVEFRRCAYDLENAQRKIREAGLPPALADRLAYGR